MAVAKVSLFRKFKMDVFFWEIKRGGEGRDGKVTGEKVIYSVGIFLIPEV